MDAGPVGAGPPIPLARVWFVSHTGHMSDRLHDVDPDPRRGCTPGCGACAQTVADLELSRRVYRASLVTAEPAAYCEPLPVAPTAV